MSYTNGTPFLNLPQTIGSDHRDWFDTNEAFLNMDGKFKTLWDNSGSAASAIEALQELTATLQTDLTSLEGTVDTHTSALSTINEALVLINGTLATLNTSVATKFDSAGIADPYDADHGIYAVGDVVTYNGQRYVCSTAVTAAEPFDADKWTAEDVQTAIENIRKEHITIDHTGKNVGQLLKAVYDAIDFDKLTYESVLVVGPNVFNLTAIESNNIRYSNVAIHNNNVRTMTYILSTTVSSNYLQIFEGSTDTYSTYQTEDAANDAILYY